MELTEFVEEFVEGREARDLLSHSINLVMMIRGNCDHGDEGDADSPVGLLHHLQQLHLRHAQF